MANVDQLTYCTTETNVISTLDDKPNAVGGLTASQLKAKFDSAPAGIKDYLNDTLVKYINEKIVATVNQLLTASHTHANKLLLDEYDLDLTPTSGSFSVVTSNGIYKAIPRVAAGSGVGVSTTTDASGRTVYTVSASGGSGIDSVKFTETSDGRGVISVYDEDGTLSVKAYANSGTNGGEVDACNSSGVVTAKLYGGNAGQGGLLTLVNGSGAKRVVLGVSTLGNGVLNLYDTSGTMHSLTPDKIDLIGTSGGSGVDSVTFTETSDGCGVISVYNAFSSLALVARAKADGSGELDLYDASGMPHGLTTDKIDKIGAIGASPMTLLWTNDNVSENFTEQTVEVDLSGYTAVMVEFAYATSIPDKRGTAICLVNGATYPFWLLSSSDDNVTARRNVTVSTTGVAFSAGSTYNWSTVTENDLYAQPRVIYGIK